MLAPQKKEVLRVQGNDNVIKMLDHWREKAEEGRLNAIAVVAADGQSMAVDYTTIIGTTSEYQLHFGLMSLANQVERHIWKRQAPQTKVNLAAGMNPSKQVYNAANLTMGFDFLSWLISADMRRVKHGGEPPLRIAIHYEQGFLDNPNYKYDRMMHDHVMLPLIDMIGAVKVDHIGDDFVWPPSSTLADAVSLFKQGVPLPRLEPHKKAMQEMQEHKGAVTITLREAHHWPHRNSNLGVWFEVADWLIGRGEKVALVRDTEKADIQFAGYQTVPEASLDINYRAALYMHAKCNLFVSNGPCSVDWFCSDAASVTYTPLSTDDGYKCSQPSWWLPSQGIDAGEQFPWFKGTKKSIVWEAPTVDLIKADYARINA